jgi:hypothetical protein
VFFLVFFVSLVFYYYYLFLYFIFYCFIFCHFVFECLQLAICGDGIVISPENCDAGANNGIGCVNCQVQTGWSCPYIVNESVCSRMSIMFSRYFGLLFVPVHLPV